MVWAIEGYEPLAEVGHGETGLVISARDTATGASVAIKYLAQDVYETPGFVVRYRGEVAMLGLIEHPNVANVYELVEENDAVGAVVTEMVDGVSLREVLQQTGPLEPQAALFVAQSTLLALGEVHGRSIVHRSVKPENLLIDANGTVKVVDIGLSPPSRNRMPANPVYAAPELWHGEEPTPTSDVFAATAILFESLVGQPPHSAGGYLGRSGETADAVIGSIRGDIAPRQIKVYMAHGLAAEPMSRLGDARAALEQMNVVAHLAYGPNWYETGLSLLQRRLPTMLASRPPVAYLDVGEAMPAFAVRPSAPSYDAAPEMREPAPPPPAALLPPPMSDDTSALSSTGTRLPFRAPAWTDDRPAEWLESDNGTAEAEPSGRPRSRRDRSRRGGDAAGRDAKGRDSDGRDSNGRKPRSGEERPAAWEAERRSWLVPEGQSHRKKSNRMSRVLTVVGVLVMLMAGGAFALKSAFGPDGEPSAAATESQQPTVSTGPTVPPASSDPTDTTKPSQPAGLRVIGRSVSGVTLDWSDATDDVDVAGYIVVRNGERIGTTYEPGYTDSGLQAETRYEYAVSAFDAAGNVSATSTSVAATTLKEPDTVPPGPPGSLAAPVANVTATSIRLTWRASTDNVGVAGYRVFRGGRQVASNVTALTYTDTGLTPSTSYSYVVRAFDTSTNVSSPSNTVTRATIAQTTAPPPTTSPPPPTPDVTSVQVVISGASDCQVSVTANVTAIGPLSVTVTFTINGTAGTPVSLDFPAGTSTQSPTLASGITDTSGTVNASAGDESDSASWSCPTESPGPG
jgi:eukaryotic-like serine/threonine-protein kinase